MSRFRVKRNKQSHPGYATYADFCKSLEDDLGSLYLLAFLLIGNHGEAEQCFIVTVEDAVREDCVFRGWERVWIRRCLLINAIRLVFSGPAGSGAKPDLWGEVDFESAGLSPVDAVARLAPPIERFVFVMSVLEKYSEREGALLLGCSRKDVVDARIRALAQLTTFGTSMKTIGQNGTCSF